MKRRYLIQATGSSIFIILAGCNASEDNSRQPNKGTRKQTETSLTPSAEENPPITQAIASSREQIDKAITALNETDVIEDGEIGISTPDGFKRYRDTNKSAVIGPAKNAQRSLEEIRTQAKGPQAEIGKVLLGISVFTVGKWKEYTDIVRAFTAFNVSLSKISEEDARSSLDAAQDSVTLLTKVADHREKQISTLRRIRSSDGDPNLPVWHPEQEASELDSLGAIVYEMKPLFEGLRAFISGTVQSGRAATLTGNGKYTEAMNLATSARTNMDTATTLFQEALERNVRYYGDLVTALKCQSSNLHEVTSILVNAIQAYQKGNPRKGEERLVEYREKVNLSAEDC